MQREAEVVNCSGPRTWGNQDWVLITLHVLGRGLFRRLYPGPRQSCLFSSVFLIFFRDSGLIFLSVLSARWSSDYATCSHWRYVSNKFKMVERSTILREVIKKQPLEIKQGVDMISLMQPWLPWWWFNIWKKKWNVLNKSGTFNALACDKWFYTHLTFNH